VSGQIDRRSALKLAVLALPVLVSGCDEQTSVRAAREARSEARTQAEMLADRRKMLERVRKGDRAMPGEKPMLRKRGGHYVDD
jgi:LytS/YehU family sensor histidine kinase